MDTFYLFNQHIYLGGGGGGTARNIGDGYSSTSYGGALIGTFIQPQKAIHYYIELGIWSGNISPDVIENSNNFRKADDFLIVEPGTGIALNVSKYSKILFGISYRAVGFVDDPELSKSDLGGVSLQGSVVFGVF